MNGDFPRIITLLRKERNLSQKQVASDLGISQALLSHYEKGIRECSLDFVVKTADYYDVSCDYLLGRTAQRSGNSTNYMDFPDNEENEIKSSFKGNTMLALINKRLLSNTISVIFDILSQINNKKVIKYSSDYLMLATYKIFRTIHCANIKNSQNMYAVDKNFFDGYSSGAMNISFQKLKACTNADCKANYIEILGNMNISPETIAEEYPKLASSVFNLVQHAESNIKFK